MADKEKSLLNADRFFVIGTDYCHNYAAKDYTGDARDNGYLLVSTRKGGALYAVYKDWLCVTPWFDDDDEDDQ